MYDELGNKAGRAHTLSSLAWLAAKRGEYSESYSLMDDSLRLGFKLNLRHSVAESLENLASLVLMQGDPHRAVCLWGAAEGLREAISCPLPVLFREAYDKEVTAARTELGREKFAERWNRGRSLTLEQAVQYALHEELF